MGILTRAYKDVDANGFSRELSSRDAANKLGLGSNADGEMEAVLCDFCGLGGVGRGALAAGGDEDHGKQGSRDDGNGMEWAHVRTRFSAEPQ